MTDDLPEFRGPEELKKQLRDIDGRGYPAYKELVGSYDFGEFTMHIDHVQGDPFASPSRIRLTVPHRVCRFPNHMLGERIRRIALGDFVARRVRDVIAAETKGRRGTGKSGRIIIDAGGQQVLERSAVLVSGDAVEARLDVGMPGYGRRVAGKEAEEILFLEMPRIVREGMLFDPKASDLLGEHITSVASQSALRAQLAERKLVAFIADGSILPRESGVSQAPMDPELATLFESCSGLSVSLALPNGGEITGLGIPEGVTLIVGGGFHGKSTLLDALQTGVFDHIPGDGRECVVTRPDTCKIRAEDGRRVENVDISPFIGALPSGVDTVEFRTEKASGSTSQAASIIEALETGTEVLLIDEDTSATNFMVRDARMQRLIPDESEPIIPFVDCARALYDRHGVSTVIVMGGCGDYLDVADTVILMDTYRPVDATARAKEVAHEVPSSRRARSAELHLARRQRVIDPASIDASHGRRAARITTRGMDSVVFGSHEISFRRNDMLVDESQLRAIGEAIEYARRMGYIDGTRSLAEITELVARDMAEHGVDCVSSHYGRHPGSLAFFRRHDLAAAINRLPEMVVRGLREVVSETSAPQRRRSRPSRRRYSRSKKRSGGSGASDT